MSRHVGYAIIMVLFFVNNSGAYTLSPILDSYVHMQLKSAQRRRKHCTLVVARAFNRKKIH